MVITGTHPQHAHIACEPYTYHHRLARKGFGNVGRLNLFQHLYFGIDQLVHFVQSNVTKVPQGTSNLHSVALAQMLISQAKAIYLHVVEVDVHKSTIDNILLEQV